MGSWLPVVHLVLLTIEFVVPWQNQNTFPTSAEIQISLLRFSRLISLGVLLIEIKCFSEHMAAWLWCPVKPNRAVSQALRRDTVRMTAYRMRNHKKGRIFCIILRKRNVIKCHEEKNILTIWCTGSEWGQFLLSISFYKSINIHLSVLI